jgi:hypothetical protein
MRNHHLKLGILALLVLTVAGMDTMAEQSGSNGTAAQWNGTTYHLGEDDLQVILPVNGSEINLTLSNEAENMTLFDERGKNVTFSSSYRFRRGDHIYSLKFERPLQGRLVYTMSRQGQQFILPIQDAGPVRIILPQGYTTGERSLGIARPQPDKFVDDPSGLILTWNNTTQVPYIEVTYYRRSAPQALMIILAILVVAGLALLAQYYISIRKLKAARVEMENERN